MRIFTILTGLSLLVLPEELLPAASPEPAATKHVAPTSPTNVPPLTNAAQVLRLSPNQAKANHPVSIRGTVTAYDHRRVMFVQDETAGVFVYYTGDHLPIRPGQPVQVTGVVNQGRFSPIIDKPAIEAIEDKFSLNPQPVTLAQIQYGGLDAQWVELTGLVRSLEILDGRLTLELADPPNRVLVWIPEFVGYERLSLPGSKVRIRGVAGSSINDRGLLRGFEVFANSLADITVLQAPPADPFSTPSRNIAELKNHEVRGNPQGMVRVSGVVTFRKSRGVIIQDATGGLEVLTQSPLNSLPPGTAVEAVGYPGPILESPKLEDAQIRRVEVKPLPQPLRLASSELSQALHNNRLVEIEGEFLGRINALPSSTALALRAGDRLLTAVLEAPTTVPHLEPGAILRLTGIWRYQTVSGDSSILLRSPGDVQVIKPAPASAGVPVLLTTTLLAVVGLAVSLVFIRKQRRQMEHVLQLQTSLQAEMQQNEQQLRRSIEERERIGRDLHDDIIQSIYAAGLGLEDCRRLLRQSPHQVEARLATAINTLNDTIRGVRGFIAGLEPKVLNGREFKTALKSLALTSGESATQFQFEVDPTAANSLTSTQATQLLHIAKEAMSNSLRHAHAGAVTVSLHSGGKGISLEIRDDGVGFEPATVGGPGQGLRNMSSRAREIGGDLQTVSSPGRGCRIVVTVPLRNAN